MPLGEFIIMDMAALARQAQGGGGPPPMDMNGMGNGMGGDYMGFGGGMPPPGADGSGFLPQEGQDFPTPTASR